LETGLVSPQFHVSFDDHFETTRPSVIQLLPVSKWQEKAHFIEPKVAETSTQTKQMVTTSPKPASKLMQANERAEQRKSVEQVKIPEPRAPDTREILPPETQVCSETTETEPSPMAPRKASTKTRSGRTVKPPKRLIEVFNATLTAHEEQEEMCDTNPLLFAFAASADPDTMYLHQVLKQPDRKKFLEAMEKEINDHTKNGHWKIVHRSEIPKGMQILPAVRSMKWKRRIST
jgi:hypothetical protein